MRRYLVLALAALALAIASPSAFAIRVIFDPPIDPIPPGWPPPGTLDCTHSDPCNISVLNQTYQVDFLPCSDVEGVVVPSGMSWCLWMNNVTLHPARTFTFEFLVPSGGSHSGEELECSSIPEGFATDNCPEALPGVGELFTVSFFANPPVPNRTNFYLFTDFVNSPGTAAVTLSVPEPGGLGLFGLGLLGLGVGFGWQKRRQMSRSNKAA